VTGTISLPRCLSVTSALGHIPSSMTVHKISPLKRQVPVSRSGLAGQWFMLPQKVAPLPQSKAAGPSCTIAVLAIESREKVLQEEAAKKRIHSSERVTPTKCPNAQALALLLPLPRSWTPHIIPWIPPPLGLQVTVLSSNLPKPASVISSHLSLNGEISCPRRSSLGWLMSPGVMMILWKRMKSSLCWNLRPALILTVLVLRVLLLSHHIGRSGPPDLSVVFPYLALQLAWTSLRS